MMDLPLLFLPVARLNHLTGFTPKIPTSVGPKAGMDDRVDSLFEKVII